MAKPRLSDIIQKHILKKIDRDSYLDLKDPQEIKCISTGSLIIDRVIGLPGIPRGRITEIFGDEATGKTTLATSIAIETQNIGGTVAYLDLEQALHLGYAKDQGLNVDDPDKFAFFQPGTFEEAWKIARDLITLAKVDLLVIDSVSALIPTKILEASLDKEMQPGVMARMMSQFVSEMVKRISESKTAFVFLNQMRSRIKMNPYDTGPDKDTSGGRALKFYASIRLELIRRKIETIEGTNDLDGTDEKQAISNLISCVNRKNKIALPYRKADFVIRFGKGIDNVRSVIDVGVNLKLIKKTGAWYEPKQQLGWKFDPEFMSQDGKIQGVEKVRSYCLKHVDAYQKLIGDITIKPDEKIKEETEKQETSQKIESFAEMEEKKLIKKGRPKKAVSEVRN